MIVSCLRLSIRFGRLASRDRSRVRIEPSVSPIGYDRMAQRARGSPAFGSRRIAAALRRPVKGLRPRRANSIALACARPRQSDAAAQDQLPDEVLEV